jgi:hypothetical protein
MERFCGTLGARITSRLHPYATLAHYIKRSAQLSQLKACYTLVWDHLSTDAVDGALSGNEVTYCECKHAIICHYIARIKLLTDPHTILRPPRSHSHAPDAAVRLKISKYFAEVYACRSRDIGAILPPTMTRWGKVRIANGGDKIRSSSAVSQVQFITTRDSSFVRVRRPFL